MNLHSIPKEITTPKIDITWERAIAAFQRNYDNAYPIQVTVVNNQVTDVYYQQRGILSRFEPYQMQDWGTLGTTVGSGYRWRESDVIQWDLINVVMNLDVRIEYE